MRHVGEIISRRFAPQHDAHMNAYLERALDAIMRALNVNNIEGVEAWYACGDGLI